MALSEVEKRILLDARELIETGRQTYICRAIQHSRWRGTVASAAKSRLRKYIMQNLDGRPTLDLWLYARTAKWPGSHEVRATRIAWINWMLEE
jgi:hypothetical protein